MIYQESQVHQCPVCEGEGSWPPNQAKQRNCHGCQGKGWVVVWVNYKYGMSDITVSHPKEKEEEVGKE